MKHTSIVLFFSFQLYSMKQRPPLKGRPLFYLAPQFIKGRP